MRRQQGSGESAPLSSRARETNWSCALMSHAPRDALQSGRAQTSPATWPHTAGCATLGPPPPVQADLQLF